MDWSCPLYTLSVGISKIHDLKSHLLFMTAKITRIKFLCELCKHLSCRLWCNEQRIIGQFGGGNNPHDVIRLKGRLGPKADVNHFRTDNSSTELLPWPPAGGDKSDPETWAVMASSEAGFASTESIQVRVYNLKNSQVNMETWTVQ